MQEHHTTHLNGFWVNYENYRNAFIITFRTPHKKREYRKEHLKRLSTAEFHKLILDIENATNLKEMFLKVEYKGFKKEVY